jgi:hypothetical protein
MMNKIKGIIPLLLISLVIIGYGYYSHETAHAKICEYFGGKADITYGLSVYTTCHETEMTQTQKNIKAMADSMNEAFAYQLMPLLAVNFLTLAIVWFNFKKE